MGQIVAADFFVVPTATGRLLFVLVMVGASALTTPISPAAVHAVMSSEAASQGVWSRALRILSPASVP